MMNTENIKSLPAELRQRLQSLSSEKRRALEQLLERSAKTTISPGPQVVIAQDSHDDHQPNGDRTILENRKDISSPEELRNYNSTFYGAISQQLDAVAERATHSIFLNFGYVTNENPQ